MFAALIDASFCKAPEGGEDTGPNPTDRGKSGSKHHVLTDARGVPWNATVTAANVNEVTQVLDVLLNKPAVGGKPGPQRELPERLQGDGNGKITHMKNKILIWDQLDLGKKYAHKKGLNVAYYDGHVGFYVDENGYLDSAEWFGGPTHRQRMEYLIAEME